MGASYFIIVTPHFLERARQRKLPAMPRVEQLDKMYRAGKGVEGEQCFVRLGGLRVVFRVEDESNGSKVDKLVLLTVTPDERPKSHQARITAARTHDMGSL